MQTFILKKSAREITELDIERIIPSYIGDGYRDLNITFVNEIESYETWYVKKMVRDALKRRGISATLKSTLYVPYGEPELIVELGDVSNEGRKNG